MVFVGKMDKTGSYDLNQSILGPEWQTYLPNMAKYVDAGF